MRRAVLTPATGQSPLVQRALAVFDDAEAPPDAGAFGVDVRRTLAWCVEVGAVAPHPGQGRTRELWELLAAVAAHDVAAARILEPHLDALAILDQAGTDLTRGVDRCGIARIGADASSSWGVFAAEGPGVRVEARADGDEWILDGTKPWCSLAGDLSHALVTAHVGDAERGLFAVDLASAGVRPHDGPWHARGLPQVVSAPVDFTGARAVAIGDPGWYLHRPGFAWGGMTVAAAWWGGAVGLVDALARPAASERADQVAAVHLGVADAALWGARATLAEAADLVDGAQASSPVAGAEKLLAARVRAVVVDAVTTVLAQADDALGPGPLVTDLAHARRVADLHLYVRQYHGLRDAARLGRQLVDSADS